MIKWYHHSISKWNTAHKIFIPVESSLFLQAILGSFIYTIATEALLLSNHIWGMHVL